MISISYEEQEVRQHWGVFISVPGGTRSGKVRVCVAGPPDPLPPSIHDS